MLALLFIPFAVAIVAPDTPADRQNIDQTRPERIAGPLKRGTLASIATRFGRLGWLMSLVNLIIFIGCFVYRYYLWGLF